MIVPINKTTQKYSLSGQLKEVRKITAWRNGYVWATEFVGFIVASSYDSPCIDTKRGEACSLSMRDSQLLLESMKRGR